MQGDELKAIRQGLGLTQARFAEALGVTGTFVGLMERGEKSIEERTERAARDLLESGDILLRVTVGTWGDKFVVIATRREEGRRYHDVLPQIFDTKEAARNAAATYALDHGSRFIDL